MWTAALGYVGGPVEGEGHVITIVVKRCPPRVILDRMGAWGTAIFSNDTSLDVRGEFRDLIGAGETAERATLKILCGPIPDADAGVDPDDNDIWLGLAATMHKTGHIVPAVMERALRITESQDELERWEFPDRKRRASALAKLRETLLQPAPPPAVIKPRRLLTTDLLQGQHQVLRDPESGAQLLLRVHTFSEDAGGRYVHYVVLAWDGREESLAHADRLPILMSESRELWWRLGYMVVPLGRKPKKENLRLLDVRLNPLPYPKWTGERLIPREPLVPSRAIVNDYITRWDKMFYNVSAPHKAAVPLSMRGYVRPVKEDEG